MDSKFHEQISQKLADEGKLVEAGWMALRLMAMPPDASQVQIDEMHKAFFAGAQHVFASIMNLLELGAEPTDNDLHRLTLIQEELDLWVKQMRAAASKLC